MHTIGTLIIGGGVVWFAYLKWKDDREKLRNELWKERFEIYKEAIHAISDFKIKSIKNATLSPEFHYAIHKSRFAFPADGPQILMEKICEIKWMSQSSLFVDDGSLDKLNPDEVFGPYLKRSF